MKRTFLHIAIYLLLFLMLTAAAQPSFADDSEQDRNRADRNVAVSPSKPAAAVSNAGVSFTETTAGPGLPAVSGQVRSAETNEVLAGAHVRIKELNRWAVCDFDGRFQLFSLPSGRYEISVSHVGYAAVQREVRIREGLPARLAIRLPVDPVETEDVIYREKRSKVEKADVRWRVEARDIERAQWSTLGEVLRSAPGVLIHESGNGPVTATIRGSRSDQVVVTLNGAPLNDGSGDAVDLSSIPLDAVQSVEVKSGSAGPAGAIGGVIAVSTRSLQQPEGVHATVKVESGSMGHFQGFGNLASSGKDGALQLQVYRSQNDGNFSYTDESGTRRERDNNASNSAGFFLQGRRTLSQLWSLKLHAIGRQRTLGSPAPLYQAPTPDAKQNNETLRGSVTLQRHGLKTVTALSIHASLRNRYYNNPSRQWNDRIESWVTHVPVEIEDRSRQFSMQGEHDTEIFPAFHGRFTAGLSAETFRSINLTGNGSVDDRLAGHILRQQGWFKIGTRSRYSVSPSSTIRLHTGARLDLLRDQPGSDHVAPRNDTHLGMEGRLSYHHAITKQLDGSVYLGGGNSFSPPSFNGSFLLESVFAVGNPNLKPERGVEASAGGRASFSGESVSWEWDAAGFIRRTDDLVIWRRNYRGQYHPDNLGRARFEGIEAAAGVSFVLLDSEIGGSITLQRARNDDPTSRYYGNRLPFQPDWHGSMHAQVEILYTLFRAELRFAERRYTTESNLDPYSSAGGGIEPYRTLDVSIARSFALFKGRYRLRAGIDNLTNRSYELIERMPMPGRTWYVGLKVEY
ncbi:TonB-dependent receptor [bacterium]|nr:TonB-dependent receptor [bacterium]